MKEELLQNYNKIISIKLKKYNVYELIAMWNNNGDARFLNLACDIIKEIYIDLKKSTNKNLLKFQKDNLQSGDYFSAKTQEKLNILSDLDSSLSLQKNFPELWYLINKFEINVK